MTERTALITGAARGIGFGIGRRLARAGLQVVLVDRDGDAVAAAAETLSGEGMRARPAVVDVADFAAVQAVAAGLMAELGPIHVLVNNAGISQPRSILEISEREWDEVIAIHLKGAFNWCKALAPGMVAAAHGRIVNISSVNAHTGGGELAVSKVSYAAAKAGLLGMTRALARELAPHVCVNAICPGSIATDLTAAKIGALRDRIVGSIPLGRLGTPEDIAEVVAFLATAEPCFITGEVIDVDGGQFIN
ncbi:MAG: SDR family oxidoreductase [Hyphomicrobiales bacterium]|nr:SDR family oxidoreductase [Hyphomicrobiales bacterium]